MDYHTGLEYLQQVQHLGAKLEIKTIQKIISNLPFNLKNIKFIQVAGTNGKGSTSHFITSIIQTAGYKAGLFTSPHLQNIRERITINKNWISRDAFAKSLSEVKDISQDLHKKGIIPSLPTFFEHIFLISLHHFYLNQVDFVILEVGLGGRLDATSTITPCASVITNISYDHTKTLGKRISEIAAEKAGIIKTAVPVVCGCNTRSVSNRVIRDIALKKGATFHNVIDKQNSLQLNHLGRFYKGIYSTPDNEYKFELYLRGEHQGRNAVTAIKVVEILNKKGYNISKDAISQGIAKNFVPGRIEIIKYSPQIILDSSHNEESIRALKNFLEQDNKKNLTLIFGVLRDKKYRKMIELLLPYAGNIIITEPKSSRALPAEKLPKYFQNKNVWIKKNFADAFRKAKQLNSEILITGSIYMVGEMRNIIFGEGGNG